MSAATLVKSVQRFHAALRTAVDPWVKASEEFAWAANDPDDVLAQLVLPGQISHQSIIHPLPVYEAFAEHLLPSKDKQLRGELQQRLSRLTVELTGSSDSLLLKLSDLAQHTASCRTILSPNDRFDVSPMSVMVSTAFANLQFLLSYSRRHPGKPLKDEAYLSIRWPLKMVRKAAAPMRPGDLWVFDVIARTVCGLAITEHQKEPTNGAAESGESAHPQAILAKLAPEFISISSLHKLLEVSHFSVETAKKLDYKFWPGLELIVGDPGAESLRALVVGGLARRFVADRSGLVRGAFVRFLEALLTFDEHPLRIKSRVLIAGLLWELLEQDEKALAALIEQKKFLDPLNEAVKSVEREFEEPPEQWPDDYARLRETCICLRTYSQYTALLALQSSLRLAASGGAARPS